MRLPGAASLFIICLLAGCVSARSVAPAAELPPDSAALLRQALERARPAYPTQDAAIRAGVYAAREQPPVPREGPIPTAPIPPTGSQGGVQVEARADSAVRGRPGLPAGHAYVIQIAAFRDEASAQLAAADVRRHFPSLLAVVQTADGWFRVSLGGWPDEDAARRALPSIQALYPSAWIRTLALP